MRESADVLPWPLATSVTSTVCSTRWVGIHQSMSTLMRSAKWQQGDRLLTRIIDTPPGLSGLSQTRGHTGNRFSSGYDVLEGMFRHYSPLASISFLDREDLSSVENVRNFWLTAFPKRGGSYHDQRFCSAQRPVGCFSCDQRVPQ